MMDWMENLSLPYPPAISIIPEDTLLKVISLQHHTGLPLLQYAVALLPLPDSIPDLPRAIEDWLRFLRVWGAQKQKAWTQLP